MLNIYIFKYTHVLYILSWYIRLSAIKKQYHFSCNKRSQDVFNFEASVCGVTGGQRLKEGGAYRKVRRIIPLKF